MGFPRIFSPQSSCCAGSGELAQITRSFVAVDAALRSVSNALISLLAQGKALQMDVSALQQQIKINTSVTGSALTLIRGFAASQAALSAQLAAAIATNDPVALAALQDTIDASVSELSAADKDLAAAVAQNTPAASLGPVGAATPAPPVQAAQNTLDVGAAGVAGDPAAANAANAGTQAPS